MNNEHEIQHQIQHYIQHHIQHNIRKYKKLVYQYFSSQLLTTKLILNKTPQTPSSFPKKICALHRRCFQKHPFFTPFLLDFTVHVVCNISNEYQPPYNLAKRQYFYTRDLYPLFISKKNWHSLSQAFFETKPFYHIFIIFNSE